MNRIEFYTPEVKAEIMKVHAIFEEMQRAYPNVHENDEPYNISFFNYKGLGLDVVMRSDGFFMYDSSGTPDDDAMFKIIRRDREHPHFDYSIMSDDVFAYTPYDSFKIEVGEKVQGNNWREIVVYQSDDVESTLEMFDEAWFFQQMTAQDIIPFEQFSCEVALCYDWYSTFNVNQMDDIIYVGDISLFNLESLKGFRFI